MPRGRRFMQQTSVASAGARHVMLELMAVGVGGGAGGARLALRRGEAALRALQARRPGRRLGKSEEVMLRKKILLSSNAVSCLGRGHLLQRSPKLPLLIKDPGTAARSSTSRMPAAHSRPPSRAARRRTQHLPRRRAGVLTGGAPLSGAVRGHREGWSLQGRLTSFWAEAEVCPRESAT